MLILKALLFILGYLNNSKKDGDNVVIVTCFDKHHAHHGHGKYSMLITTKTRSSMNFGGVTFTDLEFCPFIT